MIVVDAGVLVTTLADDGQDGARARDRLSGCELAAPELIDLEVASALRRLVASKLVAARRAKMALEDLLDLPLRRCAHAPLLRRCWELRRNVSVYDGAYVALAEAMDAVLLTADLRLSRAPALRCSVEVLTSA